MEKIKNSTLVTLKAMVGEMESRYAKKADISEYSIKKQDTAEDGYAASYKLMKGESPVGDVINIPKDYFVKSAKVKECSVADNPVAGYVEGDKYIDFVVNTKDTDGKESHVYLAFKELFTPYTGGNGITITGSAIAVKVDEENANGLKASKSGLALDLATTDKAGAMSSADKTKLDNTDTRFSEIETQLGNKLEATDLEEITAEEVKALWTN